MITRCTNNYGPRQHIEFDIIPKVIALIKQNKKIPIYGRGKNIRDWIYVDDHCDAVFKILLDGKQGQSYNISANNELDNISIVNKILEILDKPSDLIEYVTDRPGHDLRYSLDSSKIQDSLNWKPQTSFDDGLKSTIDWVLDQPDSKNISNDVLSSTPWKNN